MSELWQQRGRDPLRGFRILRIGLNPPREQLYERINRRAAQMFDDGLIAETQSLLAALRRCARSSLPMHSLGYQQALQPCAAS